MANYNRYNRGGGSDRGLIATIVAIVLAGILAVVAIINWDGIKTWFKSLGSGSNIEAPAGDEDGAGNSGGTSDDFTDGNDQTTEEDTFTFDRTFLRYTGAEETSGVITKMTYECNVPYELGREVALDPDKIFKCTLLNYSTIYQPHIEAGYSPEEILMERYESGKLTLNFDAGADEWTPEYNVDQYGNRRCVLRATVSLDYADYNNRYVPVFSVATRNGENVTFQAADYGDRNWDDWSVSPSIVYLASSVMNQMTRSVTYHNTDLWNMCDVVVQKGIAQAQGVAEADFVAVEADPSIVNLGASSLLTVNTSDVLTVKVGETKKLNVVVSPAVDLQVNYFANNSDMLNWDGYVVTPDGQITGLKAGTYTVSVTIAGGGRSYTVQVVE